MFIFKFIVLFFKLEFSIIILYCNYFLITIDYTTQKNNELCFIMCIFRLKIVNKLYRSVKKYEKLTVDFFFKN